MHTDISDKKPDINLFYNEIKSDQKCGNYSVSHHTRRLLITLFFYILNISVKNGDEISRSLYLKNLEGDLYSPHMKFKIHNNNVPRQIRNISAEIFLIHIIRQLEPQ